MRKDQGRYSSLTRWLFISLVVQLSCPLILAAQLYQRERLEIPLARNELSFDVLSADESGVVLYRNQSLLSQDLQLIHVDTSFRQKWTGLLPVEKKFQVVKQTGDSRKSFFLFSARDYSDINFHLYEVRLDQGAFSKFIIRNVIPFLPTHFEVTTSGALIGGYYAGRIPVILYFEFATLRSRILPGLFNEPGELIQISTNQDNSFTILISAKNHLKQKTLWVKSYTPQGELIQNTILTPRDNSGLLFGRIVPVGSTGQLVGGVYGQRNSDFSRGIFLARLDPEGNHEMRYYPFADLQNFFQYLKAKREQRIKERIARRKIRGKKIRFQYRFLIHEVVEYNNEYVLLGEAFYPRYRNIERNYAYGSNTQFGSVVFDGYQYTHAIVIGFDRSGALLWDNSFEINDIRSFTLEQFVKMDVQNDKIALLYLYNDRIRSKVIQDNMVLEGKIMSNLSTQSDEDPLADAGGYNKLDYWYDDTFLAHGVQQLSQKRFARQSRRVFFVNKLAYR